MKMSKRGQIGLGNLSEILIVLLVIVVVAGIAYEFVATDKEDMENPCPSTHPNYNYNSSTHPFMCANATSGNVNWVSPTSARFNSSVGMENGMQNISNKFPTIGLVIAAVVIIGLVYAGFRLRK